MEAVSFSKMSGNKLPTDKASYPRRLKFINMVERASNLANLTHSFTIYTKGRVWKVWAVMKWLIKFRAGEYTDIIDLSMHQLHHVGFQHTFQNERKFHWKGIFWYYRAKQWRHNCIWTVVAPLLPIQKATCLLGIVRIKMICWSSFYRYIVKL